MLAAVVAEVVLQQLHVPPLLQVHTLVEEGDQPCHSVVKQVGPGKCKRCQTFKHLLTKF